MKMYQIDHLVHFVESPEQAIEQLSKEGLHVVAGGKHDAWGTYNSLCYFGSTYIEFIGIFDEELFEQAATKRYTLHESYKKRRRENGLTRFSLRTQNIAEDASKFKEAGFDVIGPEQFSRTTPDGSVVSWQLLHVGKPNSKIEYPFFIQWDLEDEERFEKLKQQNVIAPHEAGQLKIEAVSYILESFKPVELMSTLCGAEFTITTDEQINAEVLTVHLDGGNLDFYRPLGEGEVWDALLEHGKGLYNVLLRGADEEKVVYYDGVSYIFKS